MAKIFAFTQSSDGRLREIITAVNVSLPQGDGASIANTYRTGALWDTGATGCVITPATVSALGLKPIGMREVNHAAGTSIENTYLVDIFLPNKIRIRDVDVTECAEQAGNFGVIIGMDVITLGDFAITNVGGKSIVSFRYPSIKTIDYVEENKQIRIKELKTLGRNAACPCGSGKKVKDCCGRGIV